MTGLVSLWLPILLSAVVVFVASSIIHMALPWRRNDYFKVPDQDRVMAALRPFAIPPGDYMLPRAANMQEVNAPEFKDRLRQGPVMILTVLPNGGRGMAGSLVLWFAYAAVIGLFSAYVASRALPAGAEYLPVFRFVGTAAFLCYAVGLWHMSIWYGRSWVTALKDTVDGLVYALLTAGVFGWLWPR
jgi:hypothetical protein